MAGRRRDKRNEPRSDAWIWVVTGVVAVAAMVGIVGFLIPALAGDEGDDAGEPVDAEQAAFLYERHCGTCHGLEGQGNIGPQLAGDILETTYPDIEDQVAVIADGRNAMPPFADVLTESELRAVAEYTRGL